MDTKREKSGWLIPMLVKLLSHQEDHEQYVGDIEELYHIHKERKGNFKTNLYLTKQILRSFPYFITTSFLWGAAMFKNYLIIALRNFKKRKGYSLINITGLATGIACALFILGYVQHELSYDQFLKYKDDLYIATFDNGSVATPPALGKYLSREYPEVINTTRLIQAGREFLRYKDIAAYQNNGIFTDSEFLEMFSIELLKGNEESCLLNPHSIVLSESAAGKYFGSENPIGKTIIYANNFDLMVTGVFEDYPENSHLKCSYIMPCSLLEEWGRNMETWEWNNLQTYVQLEPGTPSKNVNAKIEHLVGKFREKEKRSMFLQPVTKLRLDPTYDNGTITYVYMFSTLAVLILLIASINFINLTTAKSAVRAKEVGIRKTVGAYRTQLARQFFVESLLLTFIAFLVAIGLVAIFLPVFNDITSNKFTLDFMLKTQMISGIILVLFVTGILSGFYPALLLSKFNPVKVLKGSCNLSGNSFLLRKSLVVSQFTASLVLILFSLVIYSQVNYLMSRDVGYKSNNIIYFEINNSFVKSYSSLRESIVSYPGINNICLADNAPYHWTTNAGLEDVDWEGKTSNKIRMVMTHVDMDFMDTFGLQMAEGRFFSPQMATDTTEAYVINEAAVKAMTMKYPIGKWLKVWDDKRQIIGVLKDYHFESLKSEVRPMAIRVLPRWFDYACVNIKGYDVAKTIEFLESKWKEVNPDLPFDYHFLDETLASQYENEAVVGNVVSAFTFLAVVISCLGLFGLSSYMAEQKTKEIGVRKVLGASSYSIVKRISFEFIRLVFIAYIFALPIAYYIIEEWLGSFPYRIELGFGLFVGVLLAGLLITVITIGGQTLKAAFSNPVNSLKYE